MIPATGNSAVVHATAVAADGHVALLTGPSGCGKSALALQMIGLGATLVADDLVALNRQGDAVIASCPNPALRGVIEARGVGLLHAPTAPEGLPLALVVTLPPDPHPARLPPLTTTPVLGCEIALVPGAPGPHFPVAVMLQLRHGRHA